MIVNQTFLYLTRNYNNNILVKSFESTFIAVWKKAAQESPLSLIYWC